MILETDFFIHEYLLCGLMPFAILLRLDICSFNIFEQKIIGD